MQSHRYPSVSFHHDGDFQGSVLVSVASLDAYDASPSSFEPFSERVTVISTFDELRKLASPASEHLAYVEVAGPDSNEHSRFVVCDERHASIRQGNWRVARVELSRADLMTFLRTATACRAKELADRIAERLMPSQLNGDARAAEFFVRLAALAAEYEGVRAE